MTKIEATFSSADASVKHGADSLFYRHTSVCSAYGVACSTESSPNIPKNVVPPCKYSLPKRSVLDRLTHLNAKSRKRGWYMLDTTTRLTWYWRAKHLHNPSNLTTTRTTGRNRSSRSQTTVCRTTFTIPDHASSTSYDRCSFAAFTKSALGSGDLPADVHGTGSVRSMWPYCSSDIY